MLALLICVPQGRSRGTGGIGNAISVAIFQPEGVRSHFAMTTKGFGTASCGAYATEILNGA
jgi:hypothetical protein